MPKCKNYPKKTYKGTEPSPKGLGWCAHSENIGTVKKGKDGKQWIIQKTSIGTKKWSRLKDQKEVESDRFGENNIKYKKIKEQMKGYKKYYIYNPFILTSIPYLVYVNLDYVYIYTIENIKKVCEENKDFPITPYSKDKKNKEWAYTKLIKKYEYQKKYFETVSSGLLFHLEKNKYITINGNGLFSFNLDDTVEKFTSIEDDYGLIIGKKNIYFLIEFQYADRKLLSGKITGENVYQKYYGKTQKIKSKSGKWTTIVLEKPLEVKNMKYKRLSPESFYKFFREK